MPIYVFTKADLQKKKQPPKKDNSAVTFFLTVIDFIFTVSWISVGLWLTRGVHGRIPGLATQLVWWRWHWSLPLVLLAAVLLSLWANRKDGSAGQQPLYPREKLPFFLLMVVLSTIWTGFNEEMITRWINLHLVVAGWQWMFGSASVLAAHFITNAVFGLWHFFFPPGNKPHDWGFAFKAYLLGWGCYGVLIGYGLVPAMIAHALFDLAALLLSAYRLEQNRSR